MPQLIFYIDGEFPKAYSLESERITIGRNSANAIRIQQPFISGFHAELNRETNGDYRLRDLNSHNGTTVNGNPLGSALLEDGDEITFGLIKGIYSATAAQPAISTGPPDSAPSELTTAIDLERDDPSSAHTDLKKDIEALEQRREELEKGLREQQGCLETLIAESEDLSKQVEASQRENEESKSHMAMRHHLVSDLNAQHDLVKSALEEKHTRNESLKTENAQLEQAVTKARSELDAISHQAAKGKAFLGEASADLRLLNESKARKEELDHQIQEMEARRQERRRELEELESGKKSLQEERNRLRGESERLRGESERLHGESENLRGERDRLKGESERFRAEIEAARRDLEDIKLASKEKEREHSSVEVEHELQKLQKVRYDYVTLENQAREKSEHLNQLESELTLRQEDLGNIQSLLNEKRRELDQVQGSQLTELNQTAESIEKQNSELQGRLEILKSLLEQTEDKCGQATSELTAREKSLEEARRDLEHEQSNLEGVCAEAEQLRKEKEEMEESLKEANREYEELCLKLDDTRDAVRKSTEEERKFMEFREKNAKLDTTVHNRRDELSSLENELDGTRETLVKLQGAVSARKTHLDQLEAVRLVELEEEAGQLEEKRAKGLQELESVQEELERAERESERVEAALDDRRRELQELDHGREKQRKEFDSTREEKESLFKELEGVRRELERAQADLEESRKAAEAHREKSRELEDYGVRMRKLDSELADREQKLAAFDRDAEDKKLALEDLEKSVSDKRSKIEELDKLAGNNGELEKIRKQLGELHKKVEASDARLSETEKRHHELSAKSEELSGLVVEKTAAVQRLSEELDKKRGEHSKLGNEIDRKSTQIETMDQRLQAAGVQLLNTTKEMLTSRKSVPSSPFGTALDRKEPPAENPVDRAIASARGPAPLPATGLVPAVVERASSEDCPPLRILNPNMQSPVHYFPDGAGNLDPDRCPPIGVYALAGCTRGSVHRTIDTLPSGEYPVLILLSGSLDKDKELIREVTREIPDKILLGCWKEGRLDRLAADLGEGAAFQQFTDMLGELNGVISVDARTSKLLKELHLARHNLYLPLPYPVDSPAWDFSVTPEGRGRGIFVSADGFDPTSESHGARIQFLNQFATKNHLKVTVYHHFPDVLAGLEIPDELFTEPNRTLTYGEYLILMAEHRFVMGFGKDLIGGDVFGGALLSRSVYLAGDGDIAPLLFPETFLESPEEIGALETAATRLLDDDGAYEEAVRGSQARALKHVSFAAARARLAEFFASIPAKQTVS